MIPAFSAETLEALRTIASLRTALATSFMERGDEAQCFMVALLAREHVLLLGPPGTGKSAITQAMAKALGGSYFERLLTAFTVPEELFGPYSILGLQEDRYERKLDGYLPTAKTAFLDEIFKGGSPILNALLTLLNERAFDNGSSRSTCPLEMCIGASNELPADASLDALYDRFMLRRWVSPIRDRDARKRLLAVSGEPAVNVQITAETLRLAREAVAQVVLPEEVQEALLDLHDALGKELGLYVSDRRLRKMKKLIQAAAAIEGRAVATLDDMLILTDSIWQKPDERPAVHAQVCKISAPALAEALKLLDAAIELAATTPETGLANVQKLAELNTKLGTILATVQGLGDNHRILAVVEKIKLMKEDVARKVTNSLRPNRTP